MDQTTPPGAGSGAGPSRVLATSSIASIYTAMRPGIDGEFPVVVKAARNVAACQRIDNEAAVLAWLQSVPSVVRIIDTGRFDDGRSYFTMEYCAGGSLADLLRSGPRKYEEAVRYGVTIARAAGAIHDLGVAHRGINPAGILITEAGELRLGGFSSAAPIGAVGFAPGPAPEWLAPELVADPAASTVLADVYAIGATVYFLVTGQAPYAQPGELAALGEDAPAGLYQVLAWATQPDPSMRYQSAPELAHMLEQVAALAAQPRSPQSPATIEARVYPRSQRPDYVQWPPKAQVKPGPPVIPPPKVPVRPQPPVIPPPKVPVRPVPKVSAVPPVPPPPVPPPPKPARPVNTLPPELAIDSPELWPGETAEEAPVREHRVLNIVAALVLVLAILGSLLFGWPT